MKKRFFILALAVLSLNATFAQDSNNSNEGNSLNAYGEVGINAMRLVTFGMNQPGQNTHFNPYLFTAEGGIMNFGVRAGFANWSTTYTELPVPFNGEARYDRDTSMTDFRVGIFYTYKPDSRWSFKFGVDYYSAQMKMNEKSDYIAATTTVHVTQLLDVEHKESGFAPFINAQYHITPRVGIGTELLYRMGTYTWNETGSLTQDDDVFVVEKKYEGKRSYFILPTALFLTVRF